MTDKADAAFTTEVMDCLLPGDRFYDVQRYEIIVSNTEFVVEALAPVRAAGAPLDSRDYGVRLLDSNGQRMQVGFGRNPEEAVKASGIRERLEEFRRTGF